MKAEEESKACPIGKWGVKRQAGGRGLWLSGGERGNMGHGDGRGAFRGGIKRQGDWGGGERSLCTLRWCGMGTGKVKGSRGGITRNWRMQLHWDVCYQSGWTRDEKETNVCPINRIWGPVLPVCLWTHSDKCRRVKDRKVVPNRPWQTEYKYLVKMFAHCCLFLLKKATLGMQ